MKDKFKSASSYIKNQYSNLDYVFDNHKELSNIGSKEEYFEYIKTIFPDSSINSIFFHGGKKGIESFKKPGDKGFKASTYSGDYGIYFTSDKLLAKHYLKSSKRSERQLYTVVLNIRNPKKTNAWFALRIRKFFDKNLLYPESITINDYNKLKSEGHDSILWHGEKGEAIVFEPEQIHILGSEKDIYSFKKWKNDQNNQVPDNIILKQIYRDNKTNGL